MRPEGGLFRADDIRPCLNAIVFHRAYAPSSDRQNGAFIRSVGFAFWSAGNPDGYFGILGIKVERKSYQR